MVSIRPCGMFLVCVCVCVCCDFYRNLWEQRPLLLRRHKPQYNDGWFSTKEFDRILRKVISKSFTIVVWPCVCVCACATHMCAYLQNSLDFTTNIDVTSYQDGERCTHNPDGRAVPEVVWGFYQVWANYFPPLSLRQL